MFRLSAQPPARSKPFRRPFPRSSGSRTPQQFSAARNILTEPLLNKAEAADRQPSRANPVAVNEQSISIFRRSEAIARIGKTVRAATLKAPEAPDPFENANPRI